MGSPRRPATAIRSEESRTILPSDHIIVGNHIDYDHTIILDQTDANYLRLTDLSALDLTETSDPKGIFI